MGYKVPPADVFKMLSRKDQNKDGVTCYFDGAGKDDNKLIFLPQTYHLTWTGSMQKIGIYGTSSTMMGKSYSENRYVYFLVFEDFSRFECPYMLGATTTPSSIRCVKE